MFSGIHLWSLVLGLVFFHVSCFRNYAEGSAGHFTNVFRSYIPVKNIHSSLAASSLGQSSPLYRPIASYQATNLSKNVHLVTRSFSFSESGVTEHSVNKNNPSSEPMKPYRNKSRSNIAKLPIADSGRSLIAQEKGTSLQNKPSGASKQHDAYSASSELKSSKPYSSSSSWRSGIIHPGGTSIRSLQSETLGYFSARTNQNKPSFKSVLPTKTELSPVNVVNVGVNHSTFHRLGFSTFGTPNNLSVDVRTEAAASGSVSGHNDQKTASAYPVQKSNPPPRVQFRIPQSSKCFMEIPDNYGQGFIRRCSKRHIYRKGSVKYDGFSGSSLQLSQQDLHYFSKRFSPNRHSANHKVSSTAESSYDEVSRIASTSKNPASWTWSEGRWLVSQTGNTKQDIVPSPNSDVQLSNHSYLFYRGAGQEKASSNGFSATRHLASYGNRMHGNTALPGKSPSASSYKTYAAKSGSGFLSRESVHNGGLSKNINSSFGAVKTVSNPYRTSQAVFRGSWPVQSSSRNKLASGYIGYIKRFLNSKVSAALPHTVSGDGATGRINYLDAAHQQRQA